MSKDMHKARSITNQLLTAVQLASLHSLLAGTGLLPARVPGPSFNIKLPVTCRSTNLYAPPAS